MGTGSPRRGPNGFASVRESRTLIALHQPAEGIPTVNEFLILLETAASAVWIYLLALAAAAVTLLIVDRRPSKAAAQEQQPARERIAA